MVLPYKNQVNRIVMYDLRHVAVDLVDLAVVLLDCHRGLCDARAD